ncbi:hypothetical protein BDZ89DRAFT_1065541 [Hymenopellis radicata]|nr:hypothetical protein BDZ89DRAFT_1065541 [Hymenopellis radicata]
MDTVGAQVVRLASSLFVGVVLSGRWCRPRCRSCCPSKEERAQFHRGRLILAS